jgi:hypothetical protein
MDRTTINFLVEAEILRQLEFGQKLVELRKSSFR